MVHYNAVWLQRQCLSAGLMLATTGKEHEINVTKSLDDQPGCMICMDRGYTDYDWWEELTRKGVYFATCHKSNDVYDEFRRSARRRYKTLWIARAYARRA